MQAVPESLKTSGFSEKVLLMLENGSYYIVGTGDSGASATMMALGATYFTIMGVSSLIAKLPHKDWEPPTVIKQNTNTNSNTQTKEQKPALISLADSAKWKSENSMSVEEAMRTPQFALMWVCLLCSATAGMGVISTAKTMLSEVFASSLPHIVTASFASTYLMTISAANLGGRFVWAGFSDKIGRYPTFTLFGVGGCIMYAGIYHSLPFLFFEFFFCVSENICHHLFLLCVSV